jgi:hypothetical protein
MGDQVGATPPAGRAHGPEGIEKPKGKSKVDPGMILYELFDLMLGAANSSQALLSAMVPMGNYLQRVVAGLADDLKNVPAPTDDKGTLVEANKRMAVINTRLGIYNNALQTFHTQTNEPLMQGIMGQFDVAKALVQALTAIRL